jgi:WD40 repeat protein
MFSPDGACIVSGSEDGTVRLWNASGGSAFLRLTGHYEAVLDVAFSLDGRRIATGSAFGRRTNRVRESEKLRVWAASTATRVAGFSGYTFEVSSVAFSHDSTRLVSGSGDLTARVWDVETGEELCCLTHGDRRVTSVAFSPDGRRVVTGTVFSGQRASYVRVWNVETKAELFYQPGGVMQNVACVAFSEDGEKIAFGTSKGKICVLDASTGRELSSFSEGNGTPACKVAFSQDGARVVAGWFTGTVRLLDSESGGCLDVIEGGSDVVAIAGGAVQYPWRGIGCGLVETIFESQVTGKRVGSFPVGLHSLATYPYGRTWAGARANHLYVLMLEGVADPVVPASHAPTGAKGPWWKFWQRRAANKEDAT